MENIWGRVIEETAPGAGNIDLSWMIPFWESFTDCVIEMDAQHVIKGVRRKVDSSFVIPDIVGKSFFDIMAEKDREFAERQLEHLKSATVTHLRFQSLSSLGRYYRWTLIPIYQDKVYSGCHGVCVDVTEQTMKEITLNWQRAIIEGGNDFVSIADTGGNVLYTNPGAYKMTRYDPASGELPPERIFLPDHLSAIRGEGLELAMSGGQWTVRSNLVCFDGTLLPIEHTIFSVRNDQDEAILIATIIRDITGLLDNEKRMEEARIAAEVVELKNKGITLTDAVNILAGTNCGYTKKEIYAASLRLKEMLK